VECEVIFYSDT